MAKSRTAQIAPMKGNPAKATPSIAKPMPEALPRLQFSEASLSAAKWLALVLMIVDHSNKYLLHESQHWMYALGRVSMPLFAFVLGYNLSRPGSLAKGAYRRVALRLAVFGLLAVPAFIALNTLPGGWWPLNIMFTLLTAVVTAWLIDMGKLWATITACFVFAWGGVLGEFMWPAVGMCVCVWAYQRQPSKSLLVGLVGCFAGLFLLNWFLFRDGSLWALAVVPVLFSLQRWRLILPRAQWLFYGIYPAHLTLIWLYLRAQG